MSLPYLTTNRLHLKPATEDDLVALQVLWSKPAVRKYLFDDSEVSMELANTILQTALESATSGYGLWLMYLAELEELVGCIGLMLATEAAEFEPQLDGMLEPIVALDPKHWSKGYAHEALVEVIQYAFNTLDRKCVCAVNDVPNIASERMLKKLGFDFLSEVLTVRHPLRTYRLNQESWQQS